MGILPPFQKSLEYHIRRVSYQVKVWKNMSISKPVVVEISIGHEGGEGRGTSEWIAGTKVVWWRCIASLTFSHNYLTLK